MWHNYASPFTSIIKMDVFVHAMSKAFMCVQVVFLNYLQEDIAFSYF
jgi:hypothetical protein